MNPKRVAAGLSQVIWLGVLGLLGVLLVALFQPGETMPGGPGMSPLLPSVVAGITPSPDDGWDWMPTVDPNAPPTWTPPFPIPTPRIETPSPTPLGGPPPTKTPRPTRTPMPPLKGESAARYSLQNLRLGPPTRLNLGGFKPFDEVAWSPDNKWLAFSTETGKYISKTNGTDTYGFSVTDVMLADVQGRQVRRLVSGWRMSWSPSGTLASYWAENEDGEENYVRLIDPVTEQITQVATFKWNSPKTSPVWLSDTELIYYQDTLILYDSRTGQKRRLLDEVSPALPVSPDLLPNYLAASPAHGLVALDWHRTLFILQRDPAGFHLVKQLEGADNSTMAFSPDGSAFAYVSSASREARIVSVQSDAAMVELPGASLVGPSSLAWSPDGAALAYKDRGGVHLVNRDGTGWRTLEGLPPDVRRLSWTSQGALALLSCPESGCELYLLPVLNQQVCP